MLHLENSQILADKHGFKYFRSRKSQLIFTNDDLDLGLNCDMNFSIKMTQFFLTCQRRLIKFHTTKGFFRKIQLRFM